MKFLANKKVVTVSLNDSLSKAIRLMMKNNISHIPVKYYKDIEGVVSKTTITDYVASLLLSDPDITFRDAFDKTPVSKVMSAPVTISDSETLSTEIIHKLVNERVGSVIIQEDGRAVGMVTKTDVLYFFKDYLEKNQRVGYFSNSIKNWLYEKGFVDFAMRLGDVGI